MILIHKKKYAFSSQLEISFILCYNLNRMYSFVSIDTKEIYRIYGILAHLLVLCYHDKVRISIKYRE